MPLNITSIKTSSNGLWQGDNPLDFAFPLLILQITLIILLSRTLALLIKPLRQPKVIAEIIGGIVLGPSVLGRNKSFKQRVFPSWSTPVLESVASIGLLFFLFLVGLELDLDSIRRSGKKALTIAVAGMSLPFVSGIGLALILRKTVAGTDQVGFVQFLVFMGVAISITAFAVLARILAELKLLTTRVGSTAMAAAAFNDVAAWILLALAIALAGDGDKRHVHKSPLVSLWVLLCGLAFVIFMMVIMKPAMKFIAGKCSPTTGAIDETYVCLTLVLVMVFGFVTDMIGIHSVFGAFAIGITIPKGEFAERLIERVEDFVVGLLLPLYFASSGLKTNVATISGAKGWGILALVIATACAGKIVGTFVTAVACRIPAREAMTLAVLMNTKGLVELIVLNIGKEKKVLNDEMFAILVLMALFTTFITTPIVLSIYKNTNDKSFRTLRKLGDLDSNDKGTNEIRVLACLHGPNNVPSLINFIESTRSTPKSSLKLFIMHLVELTERSSSIILAQNTNKSDSSFYHSSHVEWLDQFYRAFQAHNHLGQVLVQSKTTISSLSTMHDDICHVADEKMVTMIILPFPKRWRKVEMENEENNEVTQHQVVENIGHGWRGVNQSVLKNAPCTVAMLVDRGYGYGPQDLGLSSTVTQHICVLFFGGPDDREALELGDRISNHPAVKVTVVRFIHKDVLEGNDMSQSSSSKSSGKSNHLAFASVNLQKEKELDDATLTRFQSKWDGMVECFEKVASNVLEEVSALGQSKDYDLIIVGKGRFPSSLVVDLVDRQVEHEELGPIGDILASSTHDVVSSVLVIQQHDVVLNEETTLSTRNDNEFNINV